MPKRRRLFTPMKSKTKHVNIVDVQKVNVTKEEIDFKEKDVSSARGRLKGALMEVLDPTAEDSDTSLDQTPAKKDRHSNQYNQKDSEELRDSQRKSPPRQSYVLKLFDRSVDLSQFEENSPLYPICRAWMINQPKSNYQDFGQSFDEPEASEDVVQLPGPEGPPVSRIPELLPQQKARSKDNINLNYREAPPPTREQLLRSHAERWSAVRQAWLDQAQKVESRYEATQQLLNKINVNAL